MAIKWYTKLEVLGEVPYCFSRSSVTFQCHSAKKIVDFYTNWEFPDCNSSLNSQMAMEWCTKLEVAKKRCPIVFQGHQSNFKVTRDRKSPISTRIERFRTVTPAWIHRWLWNDAQCLMWYRRVALLVPHKYQVSRKIFSLILICFLFVVLLGTYENHVLKLHR